MTNKLKRTLSPSITNTTSTPPSSAPFYSATDAHPASTHSAPSYTATDAPPTFTTFPNTFAINGGHTKQLVDTLALKRHLRLLAAFHELKQRVQLVREGCAAELSEEARWSVFVSMVSSH